MASLSSKPEYPPLLKAGFHAMSLHDLGSLCVTSRPKSATRKKIFKGLSQVVAFLRKADINGELWIDGSFLTEKIDPGDVDLVLRLEPGFVDAANADQDYAIAWFNFDLKKDYHCDTYAFVEYPRDHSLAGEGEWDRAYWIRQYGFSRGDERKGIALLTLP